jgi:hypothetical protein
MYDELVTTKFSKSVECTVQCDGWGMAIISKGTPPSSYTKTLQWPHK